MMITICRMLLIAYLSWLLPGESMASAYPPGKGPVVVVDEAHFNFHTIDGRYRNFAQALEQDGYVLRAGSRTFSATNLQMAQILVVASPLSERNRESSHWSPPIWSAFTESEILAIKIWVRRGGSLLLITDHMPWAGASAKLAAAFGFESINGYALDHREIHRATLNRPFVFVPASGLPADGTLMHHAITRGRDPSERVDRIMTFMGSVFRGTASASPLLVMGQHIYSYQTDTFGKLSATTPSVPATGLWQAAALNYGKGRIAFFSEAGLFGVQWQGGNPVGMNHPGASGNLQLLLNTMHWLDGSLK
jgi:hypothetical protein